MSTQQTQEGGTRHAQYARRRRVKLAEYLEEVGPKGAKIKVSRHPDCPHGERDGYDLYGCRCPECGEHSAGPRIQEYREQRYQAAAAAVLHSHGVPESEQAELAAELIALWRNSRGVSRQHKLAVYISKTPHGLTGALATVVAEELITALRAAGANRRPEDLTATS